MSGTPPGVLITGASGFAGSRLTAKFLSQGARVVAVVRATSPLQQLESSARHPAFVVKKLASDYSNLAKILSAGKIDIVIHTSATIEGGDDEAAVHRLEQSNILFPSLLLAAMKKQGVKNFINTGTSWQNAASETYRPFNLYAATKQAFESILAHYVEDGLNAITLRLFDTYGPNDPRPKLLSLLKRSVGEPTDFSPGEQEVDLVHIDDVCRAYAAAAELLLAGRVSGHEIFTVSGGKPMTLRELVALFERTNNVKCRINWGARAYRAREVMKPTYAFRAVPGWQPAVSLQDGLHGL